MSSAQAYPVLSKYGVPFTVYLPTAFPDGIGEAWWLALEDMIAREERISLLIDRKERRFATGSMLEKYDTFEFLTSWMRTLSPPDLSFAIHDLCTRYSVDLRRCRAARRWIGTIWRSSPPIRWRRSAAQR
jgi:peptidoglycan/xylan/chitin deacetylase (PgdA/CDA1 family)